MIVTIQKHIHCYKKESGEELFFVQTDSCYVFMTGFTNLQVTGERGAAPVAVDPDGGPMIERGADISEYTGSETKQVVREIIITKTGVMFFVK